MGFSRFQGYSESRKRFGLRPEHCDAVPNVNTHLEKTDEADP